MPKRPSTAKLSPRPCPDCGKVMLESLDGKARWCVSGLHGLERELGLRPPLKTKQGE